MPSSHPKLRWRHFILVLLLLWGVWIPQPAGAADKFVAVVITGDLARYKMAHESFVKILHAGGMTDDKVQIYVQTPNPDLMSWVNSIRKAVGVGADLIVTYGAPATLAAKQTAKGVPVLFADVYDPVALGIVKDLAVPGGDITGVSSKTPLETLVKAHAEIEKTSNICALYSEDDPGSLQQVKDLEQLSGQYGFTVVRASVSSGAEVESVLNGTAGAADVIFISESALLHLHLDRIMAFAASRSKPVLSQIPGLCDMGALMTLEADPTEQGQLAGVHALQILNGSKAFTLPVRTPKKVSLIINMQTAAKLNLKVPFQALSMATKVIK